MTTYSNHKLMPKLFVPFFPKKFSAITVSSGLSWYRNQEKLDNEKIRNHEDVHQEQIQKEGWIKFMVKYFYYSAKYGYRQNPYEVEAYERAPL